MSALFILAAPAGAQSVVIHGRVEDAEWRTPLAGVRVFSSDSSAVVLTDSLGKFAILVRQEGPFTLRAERLGYLSVQYELGEDAPSRISVLLLEPDAIELEGVTAVGEAAVTKVLKDLKRRRNAYFGAVVAFDQAQLERVARVGTVWDFIRQRTFQVSGCSSALSGLCARSRGIRSLRRGTQEIPVRVCIDGRESWGAVIELNSLDIRSVALVEVYGYGRGGIRVYTPGYLVTRARAQGASATPLEFGC